MTQEDAIAILKRNRGKRLTTNQLAEQLGITQESTCAMMRRLRQTRLLNFEKMYGHTPHYEYWVKR